MAGAAASRKKPTSRLTLISAVLIIFLLTVIGLAIVYAVLFGMPTQPSYQQNTELVQQLDRINENLGQIRDTIRTSRPGRVERARMERISAELRQLSGRLREAEANIARRGSGWPAGKVIVLLLMGASVGAASWFFLRQSLWAGALIASVGIGGVTIVAFEPESLITLQVDRLGWESETVVAPATWPILAFFGNRTEVVQRPAFAIPFRNASSDPVALGEPMLDPLVAALRPCIQRGSGPPLSLRVMGFASSAPFFRQSRRASNSSNESLANDRAEIVRRRLTERLCGGDICADDSSVTITAEPRWETYNSMTGNLDVGDASTVQLPRADAELLTRTALVIIENPGACPNR